MLVAHCNATIRYVVAHLNATTRYLMNQRDMLVAQPFQCDDLRARRSFYAKTRYAASSLILMRQLDTLVAHFKATIQYSIAHHNAPTRYARWSI